MFFILSPTWDIHNAEISRNKSNFVAVNQVLKHICHHKLYIFLLKSAIASSRQHLKLADHNLTVQAQVKWEQAVELF